MKKYFEITLRDYNLLETTGSLSHLNNSILPTRLVQKRILKELKKVNEILNKSETTDDEDLIWKVQTLAKINAIEASYLGIVNLFSLGIKVTAFSHLMARRFKRKIKVPDKNLQTFIGNIKKYTGIEVKELKDLERVRKDLTFRKDKFNENYRDQNKSSEKVYLMSVVLGVFSYLNQSVNMEMRVIEFARLREDALEKMRKEKANARN